MQLPKISIVTPSYNQAKYLPETIESILNQGYPNLEYIIIDGASTDGSVEIIKQYERHLAYWVSEPDSGQSAAINKGVDRATGDLFNWINSDDVLFPGALARVAQSYIRNPTADLIVGDNARSDSDGRITRVTAAPSLRAMFCAPWLLWVAQQSTFLSLATLKRVGKLHEDLHCMMDAELYYRVLIAGGHLVRVRGLVGMIREHPEAKGSVIRHRWAEERKRIFEEYQIAPYHQKSARAKMLLYRLLDGSYARSWILSQRLRGTLAYATPRKVRQA